MKQLLLYMSLYSFLFFPLFCMEQPRIVESKFDQIVRRSIIMRQPTITAQDCATLNEFASLYAQTEIREKKQHAASIGSLLKDTLSQTKLKPGTVPALRLVGVPPTKPVESVKPAVVAKADDIAQFCRYVKEDEIDNLKRLATSLWPTATKENLQKIRDEKGRSLLFVAIEADSLFMIKPLIEEFQFPINELWEDKSAIDYVRQLKKTYKLQIERYLREKKGNTFLEIQATLYPNKIHETVAVELLRALAKKNTSKFKQLATERWPENTSENLRKVHDAHGHSLLFLAAANNDESMVKMLVEDLQMPVLEICNDITVIDLVRILETQHAEFISHYLRKHGAQSIKELQEYERLKFQTPPDIIPRPTSWEENHFVNFIRSQKALLTVNIAQLMAHDLDTGTFLAVAAKEGKIDLAKRLIEKFNAPINFIHEGRTPLDYAQINKHKKIETYLLENQAKTRDEIIDDVLKHFKTDPSEIRDVVKKICMTSGSFSLIFLCAALGKSSFIKGTKSKVALNMYNKEGETPFDVAIKFQQYYTAFIIQKMGGKRSFQVDALEKENSDSAYLNDLEIYGAVLAGDIKTLATRVSPLTDVNNLLALASHCNKPVVVRFLVETHGAKADHTMDNGTTILDVAHADCNAYLREKGARLSYE